MAAKNQKFAITMYASTAKLPVILILLINQIESKMNSIALQDFFKKVEIV